MDYFLCHQLPTQGLFSLDQDESRHLIKVRRRSPGQQVWVTDGKGHLAECVLSDQPGPLAVLEIVTYRELAPPTPEIHLALSPLHTESRWEWLLEKATELGVTRISPLLFQRTEPHRWKAERYQRLMEAALKQSLRCHLPQLDQPQAVDLWRPSPDLPAWVAHCHHDLPRTHMRELTPTPKVCLIVGPEGDLTPQEVAMLCEAGARPLNMGDHRLRSETAALALIARFAGCLLIGLFALTAALAQPLMAQAPTAKGSTTAPPSGVLALGRLKYQGGGDWYANPSSLPNLARFANQAMGTSLQIQEGIAEVGSPELFRYPWIHWTGHGRVAFTAQEAQNLRLYLTSGGFLHVDDNYGMDPFVRSEMRKVFPELEWVSLPVLHPVYQKPFPMPGGLPKIHEHDGEAAQGLGLIWQGRLVVFYSFQTDLGDGWEDAGVHRDPEELRLKALQMGANLLRYAFEQ